MNVIDSIIKDFTKECKQLDGFVSLTLVGSKSESRKLEKFNDIDLVLILKEVSGKNYPILSKGLKEIAERYTSKGTKVVPSLRAGPFKKIERAGKTVLIDVILFTPPTFAEYVEKFPLYASAWLEYPELAGKPLVKLVKRPKLTVDLALNGRGGVLRNIEKIRASRLGYQEWARKGAIYELVYGEAKVDERTRLDNIIYRLISATVNACRPFTKTTFFKSRQNLVANVEKNFSGLENLGILKEALRLKKALRNDPFNQKYTNKNFVEAFAERAVTFLEELAQRLQEKK